jgi:hypothetical protein
MGGPGAGNRALGYLRILALQGEDVVPFAVFNGRRLSHDLRSSWVVARIKFASRYAAGDAEYLQ